MPQAMPSLARITHIHAAPAATEGCADFRIRENVGADEAASTAIGPDLALCHDCLAELLDPRSRRYRYPLLACTRCGPRYSVTRRLPYQRAATSLAPYPLCADCAAEYGNPADRRFHADAIARLRQRKTRDAKPFALMAANLASLAAWVDVDAAARLLTRTARPIVLLPARARLPGVAPSLERLGVMLPATAMQWLLLHAAAGCPPGMEWTEAAQATLLVMTSANPGGEPLIHDNTEALTRLAGIADAFWLHARDIVTRCDDSLILPVKKRRADFYPPRQRLYAHRHPSGGRRPARAGAGRVSQERDLPHPWARGVFVPAHRQSG